MNYTEVVVVGAGYAGLMAARNLTRAGKDVVVLEARNRIGGRVFTEHYEGFYLDLGAQWIGPSQDRMYELAREYRVPTYKTYNEGQSVLHLDGKRKLYKGLIPPLGVTSLFSLNNAIKKINQLSREISISNPSNHAKAREWDGMTLATWMKENMSSTQARQLFAIASEAIFAASAEELSFLHVLFYTKSGRDIDTLMNIENGAQQDRFVGGAQEVANRIADELNARIRLGSPVRHILQDADYVTVISDRGSFKARQAIVALPPPLIPRISFTPDLPATQDQLYQRMPMGTVSKCFAVYDRPFWRREGLNGLAASNFGYLSVTFDCSPQDESMGVLMGFVLADKAKAFLTLSKEEREAQIIKEMRAHFGEQAGRPMYVLDQSWAEEPWTRGCYTSIFPTGVWTSLGKHLRTSFGRVTWAGTETSEVWNGYMEGAVRSGERAAQRVLQTLL